MSTELAKELYRSAREEMLVRMKIRDNILIVYLGAVSGLFALAVNSKTPEMLFCVPYLGLGASLLVCQHYSVMGHLAKFCVVELGKFFKKNQIEAPQWDASGTFHELTSWSIVVRAISHLLLLCIPAIVALAFNSKHALNSPFPYGPLWWLSLLCLFGTAAVLLGTHYHRQKLYNGPEWPWIDKEKTPGT